MKRIGDDLQRQNETLKLFDDDVIVKNKRSNLESARSKHFKEEIKLIEIHDGIEDRWKTCNRIIREEKKKLKILAPELERVASELQTVHHLQQEQRAASFSNQSTLSVPQPSEFSNLLERSQTPDGGETKSNMGNPAPLSKYISRLRNSFISTWCEFTATADAEKELINIASKFTDMGESRYALNSLFKALKIHGNPETTKPECCLVNQNCSCFKETGHVAKASSWYQTATNMLSRNGPASKFTLAREKYFETLDNDLSLSYEKYLDNSMEMRKNWLVDTLSVQRCVDSDAVYNQLRKLRNAPKFRGFYQAELIDMIERIIFISVASNQPSLTKLLKGDKYTWCDCVNCLLSVPVCFAGEDTKNQVNLVKNLEERYKRAIQAGTKTVKEHLKDCENEEKSVVLERKYLNIMRLTVNEKRKAGMYIRQGKESDKGIDKLILEDLKSKTSNVSMKYNDKNHIVTVTQEGNTTGYKEIKAGDKIKINSGSPSFQWVNQNFGWSVIAIKSRSFTFSAVELDPELPFEDGIERDTRQRIPNFGAGTGVGSLQLKGLHCDLFDKYYSYDFVKTLKTPFSFKEEFEKKERSVLSLEERKEILVKRAANARTRSSADHKKICEKEKSQTHTELQKEKLVLTYLKRLSEKDHGELFKETKAGSDFIKSIGSRLLEKENNIWSERNLNSSSTSNKPVDELFGVLQTWVDNREYVAENVGYVFNTAKQTDEKILKMQDEIPVHEKNYSNATKDLQNCSSDVSTKMKELKLKKDEVAKKRTELKRSELIVYLENESSLQFGRHPPKRKKLLCELVGAGSTTISIKSLKIKIRAPYGINNCVDFNKKEKKSIYDEEKLKEKKKDAIAETASTGQKKIMEKRRKKKSEAQQFLDDCTQSNASPILTAEAKKAANDLIVEFAGTGLKKKIIKNRKETQISTVSKDWQDLHLPMMKKWCTETEGKILLTKLKMKAQYEHDDALKLLIDAKEQAQMISDNDQQSWTAALTNLDRAEDELQRVIKLTLANGVSAANEYTEAITVAETAFESSQISEDQWLVARAAAEATKTRHEIWRSEQMALAEFNKLAPQTVAEQSQETCEQSQALLGVATERHITEGDVANLVNTIAYIENKHKENMNEVKSEMKRLKEIFEKEKHYFHLQSTSITKLLLLIGVSNGLDGKQGESKAKNEVDMRAIKIDPELTQTHFKVTDEIPKAREAALNDFIVYFEKNNAARKIQRVQKTFAFQIKVAQKKKTDANKKGVTLKLVQEYIQIYNEREQSSTMQNLTNQWVKIRNKIKNIVPKEKSNATLQAEKKVSEFNAILHSARERLDDLISNAQEGRKAASAARGEQGQNAHVLTAWIKKMQSYKWSVQMYMYQCQVCIVLAYLLTHSIF